MKKIIVLTSFLVAFGLANAQQIVVVEKGKSNIEEQKPKLTDAQIKLLIQQAMAKEDKSKLAGKKIYVKQKLIGEIDRNGKIRLEQENCIGCWHGHPPISFR